MKKIYFTKPLADDRKDVETIVHFGFWQTICWLY